MAEISVENIKQYEQVFGRAKMQRLWLEFIDDAKQKLADVELRDQEGQRLAFHSLRSCLLYTSDAADERLPV